MQRIYSILLVSTHSKRCTSFSNVLIIFALFFILKGHTNDRSPPVSFRIRTFVRVSAARPCISLIGIVLPHNIPLIGTVCFRRTLNIERKERIRKV
ncbi:hypothetical protein J3Q64DRAFT_1724123 [Phycomyces blakesleeanus]|uniref:Secreted protein n=1 Tax=Phycomyces blakesleeanus TaxID=4837 RepID=A0ABR3B856_PHYBL